MKSIKGRVPSNFNPGGGRSGGFMAQARNMAAQRAQQPQAPQMPRYGGPMGGMVQRAMAQRQMARPQARPMPQPQARPNRQAMMAQALRGRRMY